MNDTDLFEKESFLKSLFGATKNFNNVQPLEELIKHKNFVSIHNQITQSLLEKKLDEIELKEDLGFCLFFIHQNSLYKYILFPGYSESNEVELLEMNVTNSSARQIILGIILKEQESLDQYTYLHDITVFSKFREEEPKELNLNTSGKVFAIIMSILIILVVFNVAPSEELFTILNSSSKLIFFDFEGVLLYSKMKSKREILSYVKDELFNTLYNDDFSLIKFEENIFKGYLSIEGNEIEQALKDIITKRSELLYISENSYLYQGKNLFSGALISFNIIQNDFIELSPPFELNHQNQNIGGLLSQIKQTTT